MSSFSDLVATLAGDLWLRLGEASGTTMADSSGNGHNGTYTGSPTLGTPGGVSGDTDTAITLPGNAATYGSVARAAWMDRTGNLTAFIFFKTTSTAAQFVFQRWEDSGGAQQCWGLDLQTSNVVRGYVRAGGANRIVSSTITGLRDGNWHMLAVTYSGTQVKLLVDGVQAGTPSSVTGSVQTATTAGVFVGRRNDATTTPFSGSLDEAWFGPALTNAQIADIWDVFNNGTTPPPTFGSMWAGAVTDSAFTVTVKTDPGVAARLAYEAVTVLTSPSYSSVVTADADGYATLTATGLTAGTSYTYGVELAGTLDPARGTLATFPSVGVPASFSFGHASCAVTGSEHKVFDAIRARGPLFFAHVGDLHYQNINANDPAAYRAAYDSVLGSTTQSALYGAVPINYVWDDHDFGPDNSNKNSPGKPAAQATYRQCVPHYTLPATDNGGIYHQFQIGRVAFIVTDLRSYRDPDGDTDTSAKTMLGAEQKAWFKQALTDAAADGAALIVWLCSNVYNGVTTSGIGYDNDQWSAFTYERAELADHIKANGLADKVIVVQGDAHMLAYDDGTGSDFATGGGAPLPQFCAAALDQTGLVRGDNWSGGTHPGGGQFGWFDIADDGGDLSWEWSGVQVDPATGAETLIMSAASAAPPPPSPTDISNRLSGRQRAGVATVNVTVPVAPVPAGAVLGHKVDAAIAYPTPVLAGGRPS